MAIGFLKLLLAKLPLKNETASIHQHSPDGDTDSFLSEWQHQHLPLCVRVGTAHRGGRRGGEPEGTDGDGQVGHKPLHALCEGQRKPIHKALHHAHGEVKETQDSVIFLLRFPKKLGKALIEALHREETEEQAAFIKTRRTETQW